MNKVVTIFQDNQFLFHYVSRWSKAGDRNFGTTHSEPKPYQEGYSRSPGCQCGRETIVFLSEEGVRVAQQEYAEAIHDSGFAPLKDLVGRFAARGGRILVCSLCFKKLKLNSDALVPGAVIISGAELIKFRDAGACSCLTKFDARNSKVTFMRISQELRPKVIHLQENGADLNLESGVVRTEGRRRTKPIGGFRLGAVKTLKSQPRVTGFC